LAKAPPRARIPAELPQNIVCPKVLTIAVVAGLRGVSPWLDGESAGHKPAGRLER